MNLQVLPRKSRGNNGGFTLILGPSFSSHIFFSAGNLEDKPQTSEGNAMYYWKNRNLKKFDSSFDAPKITAETENMQLASEGT